MIKPAIITFNSGELSPKIDARTDVDKYKAGCRTLQNFIPTKYGVVERTPGTYFIEDATTAPNGRTTTKIRLIPFIYSSEIAYIIELGDKYARFYYGDAVLTDENDDEVWIATPYLEADLFEIQFKQIADVMWQVHNKYAQRKVTRTGAYAFELNEIDFRKGPFLLRNDLIDPDDPSTVTLACNVTTIGSVGLLDATASIFLPGHKGALFKLIHPRTNTLVDQSGEGTSDEINVKGSFTFTTHGTWTGTVYLQRNENNTDWENFRTYKGSNDRNVQLSHVEEADNVKYRITAVEGMSAAFAGDISIDESTQEGIVKVLAVLNSFTCSVEVYAELASTDATRRWAEGAWSESRGYPGTVGFFEERCVYSGASIPLDDDEFSAAEYPELR